MASLTSRVTFISVGILFLASIAYWTYVPGDDPYRCRSVLETGRWIDPPDENGDRLPFKNWQPDGCLFHNYTAVDIQQCIGDRSILTAGDSTARNLGFGIGRLLNRTQAIYDRRTFANKHSAGNFTWGGVTVKTIWAPFLNRKRSKQKTKVMARGKSWEERFEPISEARQGNTSVDQQSLSPLVFFSTGAWYATVDHPIKDLEKQLGKYARAISNVSELVGKQKSNFLIDPMDPIEGVGDQIFLAPPAGPWYQGNDTKLAKLKSEQHNIIVAMQEWLRTSAGDLNFPVVWAMPNLFVDQLKTARNPDRTGWHAIEIVVEAKANILLNMRCNAKIDRMKGFPYNRTCCSDYGIKPPVQLGLVAAGIAYLLACLVGEIWQALAPRQSSRWSFFGMNPGVFVLALVMCYYADRTQMMAKGNKLGSSGEFTILCFVGVVVAIATVYRSGTPPPNQDDSAFETDQPLLGQHQIEEWKGWMLLVMLVCHWVGVQSPLAAALVQTFMSSYLFLTGYEHTTFFMIRKDFSFGRVAAVLLRFNLLSCSMAYFMNTNYMFYHLGPLVSFWFMVVYATMAISHKTVNGDTQLLLSKICISVVIVAAVLATPLTQWAFLGARAVFNIRWNADEWKGRVSTDILVIYFGMLGAVANLRSSTTLKPALKYSLATVSIIAIGGYAHAYSTEQAFLGTYQTWIAQISIIPIIAFIMIRNASPQLGKYHSRAMSWIGKCYLEAYVLQFHLLLAGDSHGVLLIDAFKGDGTLKDRWRSLIIVASLFFWISSMTGFATINLVEIILGTTLQLETTEVVSMDILNTYDDHRSGDETDEEAYNDESPLNGVSTTNHLEFTEKSQSIISILYSPQARVALVLLTMWLLNIFSPALTGVPVK